MTLPVTKEVPKATAESHCPLVVMTVDPEGAVHATIPAAGLALAAAERALVEAALKQAGYNVCLAARLLGIGRGSLRYRLNQLALNASCAQNRRRYAGSQLRLS